MDKNAEYWGVCRDSDEFCFFDTDINKWLFIPKKFFIDIFNNLEKTHVIETNKRPKNNGIQRGGHGDSKDNSFQNKLFS